MFPPNAIEKQNFDESLRQFAESLRKPDRLTDEELAESLKVIERANDPREFSNPAGQLIKASKKLARHIAYFRLRFPGA